MHKIVAFAAFRPSAGAQALYSGGVRLVKSLNSGALKSIEQLSAE